MTWRTVQRKLLASEIICASTYTANITTSQSVSLRLKSTLQGPDAKKILRSAERRLLKIRIDKLITEKASPTTKIMQVFPQETFTQVEEFVLKSQLREHEVTKERQKNKFSCLLNTSGMNSNQPTSGLASECMQKWVTNCSQRILSDPELSVLKKGLNFAMTPKKLPVVDLITAQNRHAGI